MRVWTFIQCKNNVNAWYYMISSQEGIIWYKYGTICCENPLYESDVPAVTL